ncbi:MAG: flagellin [Selenomonadaceae bacterium]|nr:flagellin [Selenomonadaceae bacterium]
MREQLLGVPPDKGILDEGIEYLLDANTMIGSQINHMWTAGANITVARESTTAAESVIRDADMAKTMADYSRENILSQAAQAMLAQANQVPSTVLELLQ